LQHICAKLTDIYFGPAGLFTQSPPKPPLIARFHASAAHQPDEQLSASADRVSAAGDAAGVDRTYIGRLR
jgi:hypothetical protein